VTTPQRTRSRRQFVEDRQIEIAARSSDVAVSPDRRFDARAASGQPGWSGALAHMRAFIIGDSLLPQQNAVDVFIGELATK
jgi:hypothetical protein